MSRRGPHSPICAVAAGRGSRAFWERVLAPDPSRWLEPPGEEMSVEWVGPRRLHGSLSGVVFGDGSGLENTDERLRRTGWAW